MAMNTLQWTHRSVAMGYPGGGGITITGAVQGMTGQDSAMLWLARLDLMMLHVFSNLNYAMILLCNEKVAPVNFYLLSPFRRKNFTEAQII